MPNEAPPSPAKPRRSKLFPVGWALIACVLLPLPTTSVAAALGPGAVRDLLLVGADVFRLCFFAGIACVIVGALRNRRWARGDGRAAAQAAYVALREKALGATAADLGLAGQDVPVAGVVADLPVGGDTATVVALADSTVSLYLSTGGGTIGAGHWPACATAARALLSHAASLAGAMAPAPNTERPAAGRMRFFVRTPAGLLGVDEEEGALVAGKSQWSPLFFAVNDLLTAIRVSEESFRQRSA